MLTVFVLVNGKLLFGRSAVRVEGEEHQRCRYHVNDKTNLRSTMGAVQICADKVKNPEAIIFHDYDDGALELAKKILDTGIRQEQELKDNGLLDKYLEEKHETK